MIPKFSSDFLCLFFLKKAQKPQTKTRRLRFKVLIKITKINRFVDNFRTRLDSLTQIQPLSLSFCVLRVHSESESEKKRHKKSDQKSSDELSHSSKNQPSSESEKQNENNTQTQESSQSQPEKWIPAKMRKKLIQEEVKKKFFKEEQVEDDDDETKEKITAGPLLGISLLEARAEALRTGADKGT